jgi:bifunctional UDP-N-acetylglucosamine pyrophosphorylase/glucosamine-1-phosphate N-acetyltransferase
MNKDIAVIILAAGKSTRMKSQTPKVLHPICSRAMIEYLSDLVSNLKPKKVVAVLGYKHQEVRKFLNPGTKIAIQKRLIGTADAVKAAMPALGNFKGSVLVLYGDNPLLTKETINKLLKYHIENNLDSTLLTANLDKPFGYGRILRDRYSSVCGIVEEKDADDFQKDIKEINTGIICFNKVRLAESLKYIKPNNRKKEYYLTDIVNIFYKKGYIVDALKTSDINEALGINSRSELAKANSIMQARINEELMKSGVSIIDPDSAFISFGTKIGLDTTIYPFTVIERNVKIGKRCRIGPFIRLRENTQLEDDVVLGNFLEVNRSKISSRSRAKHFGYLADSQIGHRVNIGAGTVIANFDGENKNATVIKDGAFIGCDTVLIAPIKIGKNAKTGAGSIVVKNRNVPDNTTVVGVPARILNKKG